LLLAALVSVILTPAHQPPTPTALHLLAKGIVGLGSLFCYGGGRAEIALLVEDPYQGQGIGRLLLDALREHARAEGVAILKMTAPTGNTRMIRLFRPAWFSPAEAGTVTGLLPVAGRVINAPRVRRTAGPASDA
jgi:GNAT superfamily N-acetyltransferase